MAITWFDRCSVLFDMYYIIKAAIPPTVYSVWDSPTILLHPSQLRQLFFQNIWNFMGDGVDGASNESKLGLLPSRATGIVLEIGAGESHVQSLLDAHRA